MMHLVKALLVITVAAIFVTQAAPDWYALGLTDRAVHCILADDPSTIIAGTDSGISVPWNKAWYHVKMLPVTAIVRAPSTAVAVAAGNGSKSDGVYIGTIATLLPPFYSFKVGGYFASPTALLVSSALSASDPAAMHLYVGNGKSVATGVFSNDSLLKLDPIGMPDFAFGAEMPYCSALHLFSDRLYAGGYDKSPLPGSSYLEYMYVDSMYPMRAMKTTAIAEGRFSSILGSGSLVMVVADADSGIFIYDQSMGNPWHRINGPTSAPVRSLYVRQVSGSVNDNELFAATKDGVFQCKPGEPRPVWEMLGTLPAEPLYITGLGSSGDLLAATVKGVYRYGEQGIGVSAVPPIAPRNNTPGKRTLCVSVNNSLSMGKGRYNLQGRSMVSQACTGVKVSGAVVTDIR